jgi:aspergillopepsin I
MGLAALVSATHALVAEPRGAAYSVSAVTASEPQQFDPTAELHRLWSKYPTTGHIDKRQADAMKQQGSVTVEPGRAGLSFLVPTTVGNQSFNMIYDTGSADLWVYSNESSIYQSLDHPVYIPTSSAELLPNYTWAIKYAIGSSVDGVVYTDVVKAGSITATKQAVQAATHIPYEFSSDGILGLASGAINTVQPVKQQTFFETLEPTLQQKVFAANLRLDGNATWDFGYIDDSKFTGDIVYTPVVDQRYWSIAAQEYGFGEGDFSNSTIGDVIVDSGTSLVYLPEAVVDEYYSQIEGYELVFDLRTFPCNSTFPDFHFKVEGKILSIPGRDVNYATYNAAQGTCVGGIKPSLNMRYNILGNLFMHNYYVVHSHEESTPRVGFAPLS